MSMKVRGAEASQLGLTAQQVSDAVRGAMLGVDAGEVRLDDRSIGVRVRAPDSVRFNAQRLGALPVYSPKTVGEPTRSLAQFTNNDVRSQHLRENQQQVLMLTAGVDIARSAKLSPT